VDVDIATQVATLKTAEQPSNVDYLTAIRPVLPYFRDSGGTAEQTTGPPDLLETVTFLRILPLRRFANPHIHILPESMY